MGACLSCLGLRGQNSDAADRQRLLYDDYPSNAHYGTWNAGQTIPAENLMSPAEIQREQSALDGISRGLSDHIVEIFPHNLARSLAMSTSQLLNGNGLATSHTMNGGDQHHNGNSSSIPPPPQHQDILLTLVPGDKSKRSIRIYPVSRPTSKSGLSVRSKGSVAGGMNGSGSSSSRKRGDSSVLVTLDVNLP